MVIAIDVYYKSGIAKSVGVIFDWKDEKSIEIVEDFQPNIEDYVPGQFYKRELPCILNLFKKLNSKIITSIIVDGYVFVDNDFKKGLGGLLYDALDGKYPIIGVAKNRFLSNSETVIEVFRGASSKPLYVSSVGIDLNKAASNIIKMQGENRIPTILKLLDQKTRFC